MARMLGGCGTLFLASLAFAQETHEKIIPAIPPRTDVKGEFSISGTALNSVTGAPVARALIELNGFGHFSRKQASAFTDASGAFRFLDLPAGRYQLHSQKPQFAPGFTALNIGPSQSSVSLKLIPYGAIEGKILNEAGEPLLGVAVRVLQSKIFDGRRNWHEERSVPTDDLGRFRVWNLPAGKYLVQAAGRSGGTRLFLGERTPTFDSRESFTPLYFGGALAATSAVPIALEPGVTYRADFNLSMQPSRRIRGVISHLIPYGTAKFELLRNGEDISASRVALNASSGQFEIHDATPGAYRLRVTQGTDENRTQAEAALTISDSDVEGLRLTLAPGAKLRYESRWAPPSDKPIEERPSCPITVGTAIAGPVHSVLGGDVIRPQEFEDGARIFPGAYPLSANCFGGFLVGLTANGADMLSAGVLTVPEGTGDITIVEEIAPGGANLEVVSKPGLITAPALAIVSPDTPSVNGPWTAPLLPNSPAAFRNLPPGDYTVYLFPALDELEFRNPDVVRGWSGGTHARLAADSRERVTVEAFSR